MTKIVNNSLVALALASLVAGTAVTSTLLGGAHYLAWAQILLTS